MPEILTKDVGLKFSKEELEIHYNRKFDFSNEEDCDDLDDLLEKSHKLGEFKNLGFGTFYDVEEIYIHENDIEIYFN